MTYREEERNWWGWGLSAEKNRIAEGLYRFLSDRLHSWPDWSLGPPDLDDIELRPSLIPDSLMADLEAAVGPDGIRVDRRSRIFHALGRSYHDLIRIRLGRIPAPPDVVVYPKDSRQTAGVLKAAARCHGAVIPFGGGSSVVGGVELPPEIRPSVCLDLTGMNKVLSIDPISLTAKVQAGIFGPDLENALNAEGFTLGHFPQSFEFSTLGGWIATRGAGHKSTRYGKIEDMVLSLRLVTRDREIQSPRSPAKAAGGDLTALLIGSEGALGVITEAEIKIRPLAESEWFGSYLFPDFEAGLEAARKIMARGLKPAAIRVSDQMETTALMAEAGHMSQGLKKFVLNKVLPRYLSFRGVSPDRACLFLAAGEGRRGEAGAESRLTGAIAKSCGGIKAGRGPARTWHETRYTTPYLRDDMITRGLLVETLETAATWDRLKDLYEAVKKELHSALAWSGARAVVMTHLSHAYPEGGNLYFTFIAPQVRGREEEQWLRAKQAATRAILDHGGALSHHHGVGRDHKPWIEEYWGRDLIQVFKAAKSRLDPQGMLNPGVIVEPEKTVSPRMRFQAFSPVTRSGCLDRFKREVFDLLVVGGGVVGAGVAWDASLRGLNTALAEKGDFGGGTSGKSSRMIHGGLRYLKTLDLKLVREALAERRYLMHMAPHLVRPVPHLFPIYKNEGDSRTLMHLGLWGYDTLAGSKDLPQHKTVSAEEALLMEPSLSSHGLEGGMVYYDCLTDDARLTLETVKAAAAAGAAAANYMELIRLNPENDPAEAVLKDRLTSREYEVKARVVVNAAGVWADRVRLAANPRAETLLRPAKGIHITFPRELKPINHVIILKGADGRPLFAVPLGRIIYVGTTDSDFDGDVDAPHAEKNEVDYLIDAVNRLLTGPPLKAEQVTSTWAGVRPLVSKGRQEDTREISREHEIKLESERLVTVCGGKLTTFRSMAAHTVDQVLTILNGEAAPPCSTHNTVICGPSPVTPASLNDWPEAVRSRLEQKYAPYLSVFMHLAESPTLASVLDHDLGLIAAEVWWAVNGEMGLTLTDVMARRLGLTYLTPNNGLNLAPKVAEIMAPLLGWNHPEATNQIRAYQDYVGREMSFGGETNKGNRLKF